MNDAEMHAVLDAVEIVDVVDEGLRVATREDWVADAACRGMNAELFYPGRGDSTAAARAACASCPVSAQCLEYALRIGEKHGIWGNTSERERRALRRQIRKAPAPIQHGTASGYQQHSRRGIPACAACREAHTRYRVTQRHTPDGEAA